MSDTPADRFDPDTPNGPMLGALLAGHVPGRVWVADPGGAAVPVARLDYHGITFVGRRDRDDPAALDAVLDELRALGGLLVTGPDASGGRQPGGVHIDRLEFTAGGDDVDALTALAAAVPADVTLRPLDAALLAACGWRREIERACGDQARFFAVGRGVCAVRDGEPVSEAYATFRAAGRAELGVFTRATARGQGLAAAACAALLLALRASGERPSWSCDRHNTGSLALARRLGFRSERPYRFRVLTAVTDADR